MLTKRQESSAGQTEQENKKQQRALIKNFMMALYRFHPE
jgi:hypothetical protein